MDLPKLTYLLKKRKLYMSRADKFEDTHEGATPQAQKEWELHNNPDNSESLSSFRRRQSEWTFISCWSHCEHESYALWRIFCGRKHGVAVRSQYQRLRELIRPDLEDMEVGLVDYGRKEAIPYNTVVPFFRKRPPFDYEREARLVWNIYRYMDVHDRAGNLLPPKLFREIPLDLSHVVEVIRIHPEADTTCVALVKSVVEKYAPVLLSRVETSELDISPVF
jgi:hypothetical protein